MQIFSSQGERPRDILRQRLDHVSQQALTLAMHHWECVVEGDEKIDTSRFGPAVVGINGNDPQALKRMLEEHGHMNPRPVPLEG